VPQAARYLSHIQRQINDLDVNYNCRLHGSFNKTIVMDFVKTTGCTDLWIRSMTLDVTNDDVRKAANKLLIEQGGATPDSVTAGEHYAAYFEENPCRRYANEGKAPQWMEDIRNFRTEEDKKCGFEPATLDLVYLLPFDIWRDIQGKKRISKAFEREVEKLKNALNVHEDSAFTRKVIESFFPKVSGLRGGRVEVLSAEQKWVIKDYE